MPARQGSCPGWRRRAFWSLSCKRVYLTEKAAAVHAHMLECIAGIEARMIQDFTLEEQQQFVALLDRAIANMGSQVMKEES